MEKYNSLIMNDNYNKYLEKVQRVIDNYDLSYKGVDITSAPLSPMMMDSDDMPVLFMPDVINEYNKIVEKINNSSSKEYNYMLLGKRGRLDKEDVLVAYRIMDCNDELEDGVLFDTSKLTDALRIMQCDGYNFISLVRTNAKYKEFSENDLDNYISESMKEQECLRDSSLNISVSDINVYEKSIYEYFKGNSFITTCSTIIMPNGEVVMFGIRNGKLCRYTNLIDVTTAHNLKVSDKEEYLTTKMSA